MTQLAALGVSLGLVLWGSSVGLTASSAAENRIAAGLCIAGSVLALACFLTSQAVPL